MSQAIKLFISYSHNDEPYFKVFNKGLKDVIKNAEYFDWKVWDDTSIHVGTFWDDEIQKNIQDCNVAMLLVSVGFMASNYIKEKEYDEFIKRYKEKGILIVPIVFTPCDFNRWEDLSKLQFFKPKGSDYGKSEIENFTYADLVDFKRTDGTLIPNPNINRYHLDLVKKVEESFREFLSFKEKAELTTSQIPTVTNINKLSDYPKPNNLFTGRKQEINEFQKLFTSSRIFAIEGLGGTGKTQFTAKCIEDLIPNKARVIWLNGSTQSNFDVFVEGAGYGDVLKGEKKSDLALYSGFKDLIERDKKVIFWDNYSDFEDLAFSKFLSFANQYLQQATIVLITKIEPSIEGITTLPIVRLEGLEDDAIDFARKLKGSNTRFSLISDSDLEKICNGVNGHPLAIEFSMLLMGYGKSAEDVMAHMPEFSGFKKVEEFSKRLFLDIFNHPKTTDEERECFLKCSVFKEKIAEVEIKFLYDGKDIFYLLAGLTDKLLLTPKEGFYEMHPLVRSFSYERLLDKKTVHKKAAEYFIRQREEKLNASLEEKIFYHLSEAQEWLVIADTIENVGRKFIQHGQLGLITEVINRLLILEISRPIFEILLGDVAQIKSEWNKALIHFEKACLDSENHNIKAEGMIKFGEILYRKGQLKESLSCFENAYDFAKIHSFIKEEARALNDIGLVYTDFDELDIAFEKINSALKIRKRINDAEGISSSYNNLANIFSTKKQYLKALEFYNESIKISEQTGDNSELALYHNNIGNTLRKQKKFEEAYIKTNLALKISEAIGDKETTGYCLNQLGAIFLNQGKLEDGFLKFKESLQVRTEIGDKKGIASSLRNIAIFYFDKKNYEKALDYLFNSLSIFIQIGIKSEEKNVFDWINSIKERVGKIKFKQLADVAYNKLDSEHGNFVQLKEFFNEPQKRESPKVGRNDPCPCGSGKKYKNCHGKNPE